MKRFAHLNVHDLQEALSWLDETAKPIAGGTDLLGEMKERIIAPERLVNLKAIPHLAEIAYSEKEGLRLGALVTLAQLESHRLIIEKYPALAQAAGLAASPQLRHMGTIGGNLCQSPRCWYYRNALFPCWLKGGETCFATEGENAYHAILGGEPCHAVHPSDLAPALIALGARVRVVGPRLDDTIPLEELYRRPSEAHRRAIVLGPRELIAEVKVPPPRSESRSVYLKAMDRAVWTFALASVAAAVELDEASRVQQARLVLGGVAPIPWRAKAAEEVLQGQKITDKLARAAAEAALANAQPLRDNGYKVTLAKELVRRALLTLGPDQTKA
jgi:xanthine dehydrogenase YagS FAD-binding subunit